MGNILAFVPRDRRDAAANLEAFIHFCQYQLTIFEPNFIWQESHWKPPGVSFSNLDQGKASKDSRLLMKQPFLDFAKAYVRYLHTHRPNKHHCEMRALKCVERALLQITGNVDPMHIDHVVLDAAAALAQATFKAPYGVGREIQALAKFLTDHNLSENFLDWEHPFRRPISTEKTGLAAQRRREEKLPSQDAIDALARIFADDPIEHNEIFVTSTVALLLSAPTRIGEILRLPEDCEVEERKRDGSLAYGLRFRPEKGGDPMIKWIPDVMVDITREAISRLRRITQPARDLARWLENGGTLPNDVDKLLDGRLELSRKEATALVGTNLPGGLPYKQVGRAHRVPIDCLLVRLQASVRIEHPHFPFIDETATLRWREALFCFNANQLKIQQSTLALRLSKPNNNSLNERLGANGNDGQSIFVQRGETDISGESLKVTSHQFRHLLTTIASRGGLSSAEIARWRSSKDVKQNRAYIHLTEFEIAAMIKANDPALISSKSELQILEQVTMAMPLTTQEFNSLARSTAHITEIGFCLHDFVMSPCTKFRDCINCTEQVCVKGDRRQHRIQEKLAQVEHLLAESEAGTEEGLYGADRWSEVQRLTRDRLVELMEITEDPSIPDGALIRLANKHEFSPIGRALGKLGKNPAALPRIEDG